MQIQFLSLIYLSTTSASDLNTPLWTPLELAPALLFFQTTRSGFHSYQVSKKPFLQIMIYDTIYKPVTWYEIYEKNRSFKFYHDIHGVHNYQGYETRMETH
jgi:hypothetical protein